MLIRIACCLLAFLLKGQLLRLLKRHFQLLCQLLLKQNKELALDSIIQHQVAFGPRIGHSKVILKKMH